MDPCETANTNCSSCYTIDGHQKARRRVYHTKQVDYKSDDFTEPLIIGCWKTLVRHSLYCEEDQTSYATPQVVSMNKRHNTRRHNYHGKKT